MKKYIFLVFVIIGVSYSMYGQYYKDWTDHEIIRFYEKVELDSYSLNEDGDEISSIYTPTKVNDGVYEVELRKISYKLYQIIGTNIYMYFRYPPHLYNYDEGILDVSYSEGIFYEKQ